MNTRSKGSRLERKAVLEAMRMGYHVVRLYQPRGCEQLCDLILIGQGRVRFVEVRSNTARPSRLKALKQLAALYLDKPLVGTAEVWIYKNGESAARQRVIE